MAYKFPYLSIDPGSIDGELVFWDVTTRKWIPGGTDISYDDGSQTLSLINEFVSSSIENTGNILIHGARGEKFKVMNALLTRTLFEANTTSWEFSRYEPLSDGDPTTPGLIFAGGDVVMVNVGI